MFLASLTWSATATGWGRIVAGGQSPSKLQELDVNVLSNQECVDDYAHTSDQISEQMVCAIRKGVKGVCHGDSGIDTFIFSLIYHLFLL